MAGHYIAFEGGEGSGKSTQVRILTRRLNSSNTHDAIKTHEPGGTDLGSQLRKLLLGVGQAPVGARAETLLMAADRAQHWEQLVAPALAEGKTVVSDRSAYSSLAYQGGARALGVEAIRTINDWALSGHWPDLVVLLDCPPDEGHRAAGSEDRLERETVAFHEAVRHTYLALAEADPEHWVVLSAAGSIDDVAADVWAALSLRLGFEPA